MLHRILRYRPLAWEGYEQVEVTATADGIMADGVTIGEREGRRYGAFYRLRLTPTWVFREITIKRTDGTAWTLAADGAGAWRDGAGAVLPDLGGAIDIDLSGSPLTNTLPIRRVALSQDEPRTFEMAWIPLDTLAPFRDVQTYTRLDPAHYRYQSSDGSFEAVLTVDQDGFVTDYPGLFVAV
ncbi:MAG: putative glycolipid-binding domain-containing protein [Paracoccaceae bacterium]